MIAFASLALSVGVSAQEWEFLDSGVTNDLNGISCLNELTCYAVGGAPFTGGQGIIIKTTNSGDTWKRETIPTTEPLRAIKCVGETCYAAGDGIILRKTATTSWILVDRSDQTLWDIDATQTHSVAVGNLGTRLRATNGVDWAGYLPPRTGTFEPTLLGITFIGERGWIVGYEGTLKYTNNGGETWIDLNSDETLPISDIFTFDGQTIWTCGSFTHISKSTNAGSSWTDYEIPSIGGCGAIEFADENLGWIFGNGAILSSTNGGQTWQMVSGLDRVVFFSDVDCLGSNLCYGVGEDGVVVKYVSIETTRGQVEQPVEEPEDLSEESEDSEEQTPEPNDQAVDEETSTSESSIPICPAVLHNCADGQTPVFEYSLDCPVDYTCVGETEKPSGSFGGIFDGIKSFFSKIFSFFSGSEKTNKLEKIQHDEDADVSATIFLPAPSEQAEFARVVDRRTTCNPSETRLSFGSIDWEAGSRYPNTTIVAPHGGFDTNTDSLLLKTIAGFRANYVIARDYEDDGMRLNVNRPSESYSNRTEIQTVRSARVYNAFKNCVDQFPQKYYIEIHGNSNPSTANEIEVATVNVSTSLARYLKNRFNVHKRGKLDGYTLSIEPLDTVAWDAGPNKLTGMLSHCDNMCLHFEHPSALREDSGAISKTSQVLVDLFKDLENYTPPTKNLSNS